MHVSELKNITSSVTQNIKYVHIKYVTGHDTSPVMTGCINQGSQLHRDANTRWLVYVIFNCSININGQVPTTALLV